MNSLFVLTCGTCEQDIDVRLGFSNRTIQPLSLACPHCNSAIGITLDTTAAPAFEISYSNATKREDRQYAPFDGRNPFVDLHLDFPVEFGPYVMGMTPFMATMEKLRAHTENQDQAMQLFAYHNERLNQLNHFAEKSNDVRNIVGLYFGGNWQLFKRRVEQVLGIDLGPSLLPQDVNAALYRFISAIFSPFIDNESIAEFVNSITAMIGYLSSEKSEAFNAFIDHVFETGFINNLQRDGLGLYADIYRAELALRPALFLDLLPDGEDRRIAGRVSAQEFRVYKDLYKDLCEILARQLVLVAGLNNILKRDDYNAFLPSRDGPALSSLDRFANKTLSEKYKYLDESWFVLDEGAVESGLRNAVAHHAVNYDESTQVVTYYPEKDGVRQGRAETMTFLAFMRLILRVFREVHYLQHLIKCLLYYKILVRKDD